MGARDPKSRPPLMEYSQFEMYVGGVCFYYCDLIYICLLFCSRSMYASKPL